MYYLLSLLCRWGMMFLLLWGLLSCLCWSWRRGWGWRGWDTLCLLCCVLFVINLCYMLLMQYAICLLLIYIIIFSGLFEFTSICTFLSFSVISTVIRNSSTLYFICISLLLFQFPLLLTNLVLCID